MNYFMSLFEFNGFLIILFYFIFKSTFYVHWLIITEEEEKNSDIETYLSSKLDGSKCYCQGKDLKKDVGKATVLVFLF